MAKKYPQPKKWIPKNPSKYVGDASNIVARSSWEIKFMNWCDMNSSVIKWASEEIVIPYFSVVDNKMHRYFVDFALMVKTKSGEVKKYIVEIKPEYQTKMPEGKKKTKRLYEETATFVVNNAKWEAAHAWAKKRDMEFLILTERDLYPNGTK